MFDQVVFKLVLYVAPLIKQLFFMKHNGRFVLLVTRIDDDLLVTGEEQFCTKFISNFNSHYTLSTVAHGPRRLRLYGLNSIQHEDVTSSIDGDYKINAIVTFCLTRIRQKQSENALNAI